MDPAFLARPDVRAALAGHDIGTLFRVLGQNGWTQRVIAETTRMPQSSVSEIVTGRQVIDYRVLVRIADGLGIPREWMGLGDGGAYAGEVDLPERGEGGDASSRVACRRRDDHGGLPNTGHRGAGRSTWPCAGAAALADLRIACGEGASSHPAVAGRTYGADPQVSSASATWATRLLGVSGAEPVKVALRTAVAELHTHAGWDAFDAGLHDRAMHHYTRGMELAIEAGDAYLQAVALMYAGAATDEHGHPDDALKMLQFGQLKAADIPSDEPRRIGGDNARAAVLACTQAYAATALARLGRADDAYAQQAQARERWQPTAADATGDLDVIQYLRHWNSNADGWTWRSRSPWRRRGAGTSTASAPAPCPASSWPPSTSGSVSPTDCGWRTARSPA